MICGGRDLFAESLSETLLDPYIVPYQESVVAASDKSFSGHGEGIGRWSTDVTFAEFQVTVA